MSEKRVKCRYANKYKAIYPPKCGCLTCEQKWLAAQRDKLRDHKFDTSKYAKMPSGVRMASTSELKHLDAKAAMCDRLAQVLRFYGDERNYQMSDPDQFGLVCIPIDLDDGAQARECIAEYEKMMGGK